jgi:hypothetical protein
VSRGFPSRNRKKVFNALITFYIEANGKIVYTVTKNKKQMLFIRPKNQETEVTMDRNFATLAVISVAACFLLVGLFAVAEDAAPTNIGAEKCGKMCHKVQYNSWLETKHAKAWETLQASPDKDEKCEKCHITGTKDFPGVQCEACHGPGSEYKSMSVMKDPEKAKAAGLKAPDEAACKGCHNTESPTYKEFNFAESVKKVHEHKTE